MALTMGGSALMMASEPPMLADLTQAVLLREVQAVQAGWLEDEELTESSGLDRSWRNPGVFWTLNDSGGRPVLYALDETGRKRARLQISSAVNLDWEDLACGPDEQGRPCLYVGDIGDNLRVRPAIQIYQILEPELPPGYSEIDAEAESVRIWNAAYPGERRNAETLVVHPRTGQMHVLTKDENGGSELFALPPKWPGTTCQTLHSVGRVIFPAIEQAGKRPQDNAMATAGAISADGDRLVVSTYSGLYEWTLPPTGLTAEALAKVPSRILVPLTRQMEAVCYGGDGRTLFFTSEHRPAPLWRVERGKSR